MTEIYEPEGQAVSDLLTIYEEVASTEGTLYLTSGGTLYDIRNTLTQPAGGDSGWQFGMMQNDLNNPAPQALFNSLISQAESAGTITDAQGSGWITAAEDNGYISPADINLINTEVLQPGSAQIQTLDMQTLQNVVYAVQGAEASVESTWGSLGVLDPSNSDYQMAIGYIASWANRNPSDNISTLVDYLDGGTVSTASAGTLPVLTDAPTLADIQTYMEAQAQFADNPGSFDNLTGNLERGENLFGPYSPYSEVAGWADAAPFVPSTEMSMRSLAAVPSWMSFCEGVFGEGQDTGSPLVLDLSSDGSGITLAALNSSGSVYWDFGSGFKNASGWVTGTTGLLCVDPTGTGVITQADLFGNNGGSANGFQALAAYDTNGDGVINASDTDFNQLLVWIPTDTTGVSTSAQLHTLASLGITSISLDYTDESYQINGNTIEEQSTFVINGNTQTIADAWFAYDPVNTSYDGSYTLNPEVLFLPNERGYGQLPDLAISMSLDSTLLTEVQGLASQSFSQLLNPTYGLENVLKGILYEWAGVESVNPESSYAYFAGTDVNAQNLAFMSQLMGQVFQGTGNYEDFGISDGPYYTEAWNAAFSYLAAHLLAQAGFSNLMGNPIYDLSSDTFSVGGSSYDVAVQFVDQAAGESELMHMATNDIFVLFPGDAPVSGPENSPTIYINETPDGGGTNTLALGVAPSGVVISDDSLGNLYVHYTSTDTVEVFGGLAYSEGNAAGTIVGQYLQQIAFDDGTVWNLTGGLHLTAIPGYLAVYGTAGGGDTLDGSGVSGADLWGYTGTETYILGPATTVNAGNGTNIYVLNPDASPTSSGGASINPNASATGDQVVLHGVTPGDVTMSDNDYGALMISTSNGDLITINGGSLGSGGVTIGNVAGVDFDDGTVWNLTGGLHLTAIPGYLAVYGTASGGDTLDGSGVSGADLWGYTGTETFILGPATTVNAGNGTNLYVLNPDASPASSGGTMINPNASATGDQVVLHGVTPGDVTMSDNDYGALMIATSNGDLITINDGSLGSGGVTIGNVAGVDFDDGTVWNLDGVVTLTATGYGQSLYGLTTGTNFVADGSADIFHGFSANDTFTFTSGSSPASSGGDFVYEAATGGSNAIVFHGVTPSAVAMSDDSSGDLIFQFGTDLVTTGAGSYSSDTGVTIDHLQQVTFDDGTTWNLADGLNLTATANDQMLYGSAGGGDTLTASADYDQLYAFGGTETLVAGPGSSLRNGTGTDTDVFSAGSASTTYGGDNIYENASGGTATIAFHGIDPSAVMMWDNNSGQFFVQFSATDQITVNGGTYDTTNGFTLGSLQQITFDDTGSTTWDLTGGLNLTATSNDQAIYGTTGGGDTLTAGANYNQLYAFGGTETLVAGPGSSLHNGTGTDTDVFSAGSASTTYGGDNIYENTSGGTATIAFHGIDPSAVTMWDNNSGQFFVQFSATDQITVNGGTYDTTNGFTLGSLQQITFDDTGSTTWDLTGGLNLTAISNYQALYGTTSGGDTLTASADYDQLYAFGGTETLVAGPGSSLRNGTGTDTDVFSAGSASTTYSGDNIYENAGGGTATISFHGIDPSAVTMWDNSSGQFFLQFSSTDLVTVNGGSFSYSTGLTMGNLEQATFDDGTTWTFADGLNLTATSNDQALYGSVDGGDTLTADGNYDYLYAFGGAETLVGGYGTTIYNGTGNDTDVFSTGFGSATIYANASGGSSNTIEFHGVTASDLAISDNTSGQLIIQDSTGDQLTVSGGSFSWTTGFAMGNVQQIALDAGTDINLQGSLDLTATGNSEALYGTGYGDHMVALGNGDYMYGISGNNTMVAANSGTTYFYGGSGNDLMIAGGAGGTNYMTMGSGADEIKIESASSNTTVTGFSAANGDVINISHVLSGYDPLDDALANFVQETTSGGNTAISVDPTGSGNFSAGPLITLNSVTLADLSTLVSDGTLIVQHHHHA